MGSGSNEQTQQYGSAQRQGTAGGNGACVCNRESTVQVRYNRYPEVQNGRTRVGGRMVGKWEGSGGRRNGVSPGGWQ